MIIYCISIIITSSRAPLIEGRGSRKNAEAERAEAEEASSHQKKKGHHQRVKIQLASYDNLEKAEGKPFPRRQSLNNAENDEESQRKSKSQQKLRAINPSLLPCEFYTLHHAGQCTNCRSPRGAPKRWGAFVKWSFKMELNKKKNTPPHIFVLLLLC